MGQHFPINTGGPLVQAHPKPAGPARRGRGGMILSAWTPLTLPNLELWLKADAIDGLADGGAVAEWKDFSGNVNHAAQGTAGNRPLYKTGVLNGRPVVRFDGTNDFLTCAAAALSGTAWTIFCVCTAGTASPAGRVFVPGAGVEVSNLGTFAAGSTWGAFKIDDGLKSFGIGVANSVILSLVRISNAVETGWGNGTQAWTGNPTDAIGLDAPTVGAEAGGTNPAAADIAEVIVYSSALPDAQRQQVERYLGNKYAIALS